MPAAPDPRKPTRRARRPTTPSPPSTVHAVATANRGLERFTSTSAVNPRRDTGGKSPRGPTRRRPASRRSESGSGAPPASPPGLASRLAWPRAHRPSSRTDRGVITAPPAATQVPHARARPPPSHRRRPARRSVSRARVGCRTRHGRHPNSPARVPRRTPVGHLPDESACSGAHPHRYCTAHVGVRAESAHRLLLCSLMPRECTRTHARTHTHIQTHCHTATLPHCHTYPTSLAVAGDAVRAPRPIFGEVRGGRSM